MATLGSLISKRGGNRGVVTRLLGRINNIMSDQAMERDRKIHELNKKLRELHDKIKVLETLDSEIVQLLTEEEVATEITNADTINALSYDTRDEAEYVLSTLMAEKAAETAATNLAMNPVQANSVNPTITVTTATDSSHLPKFNLPEFSGNILLWSAFWDIFEVEVHQKTKYSNATKFNFLNSRLSGEAKALLNGLVPSNDNYLVAVELLKKRFGQPGKIIMAHMRALVALPKPGTDRVSLRKFVDSLESHIRGLEALNKKTDSYGDLLVCILLDKLSAELRRNLARQSDAAEWDLDTLRKSLLKEIEILEDSESSPPDSTFLKPARKLNVMFTGANSATKCFQRKMFCPFCTGEHWATECTTAKSVEQRYEIAKIKKLCFNCLAKSHQAGGDCPSKNRCRVCRRAHHTSLHQAEPTKVTGATILSKPLPTSVVVSATGTEGQTPFVFLETAIVIAQSPSAKCSSNVLVDKGAQRTFMTSKLAKLLKLQPIWRESLILIGFTSARGTPDYYDVAQFSLIDRQGSPILIQAIIVQHIVDPLADPHRAVLHTLPHLKDLILAHPASEIPFFEVDILIGADFYWNIVGDQIVRGPGPTAVISKIGYLVSGQLSDSGDTGYHSALAFHVSVEDKFDVTRFWQLEMLGIEPETESCQITHAYQEHSVEFRDGRYIARLPWRKNHPHLSSNLTICEKRTRGAVMRLASKNAKGLQLYNHIIEDQLSRGFIEKVPSNEMKNQCHYIPHFGVFKDSITTPLRIVYDCSCKTPAGVCLNDCLDIGPPLQNDILAVLLRFRVHQIGLTADIEKAFHQVGLHENDRDYVRFLWLKNPLNPKSDFEIYRFRVIPFGASCSPFILLSVIKKHLQLTTSPVAADINRNIYVDNLISGCKDQTEAVAYYHEANRLLSGAGLNLQSWGSNCSQVTTTAVNEKVVDESALTKVLGLSWRREDDTLHLPQVHLAVTSHSASTKRDILRSISGVYDPLGFITPLTIPARILIQEVWRLKLGWDETLPLDLVERWQGIAGAIEGAQASFARPYFTGDKSLELHVFVDASQAAYGAVAYLSDGISTSFVLSKSRVAPLRTEKKLLTIPQTELMAAVIGTRIASSIISAFQPLGLIPDCYLWSDSQIVLHWIRRMGKIKSQFVHNRVDTVRTFNRKTNAVWNYCPTHCNPADLLSRGSTLRQFLSSGIWRTGPKWLPKRDEWPVWEGNYEAAATFHLSVIRSAASTPSSTTINKTGIGRVLDISRYKFAKLIRTTSIILRFVENIKLKDKSRTSWRKGYITVPELQAAEKSWILATQEQYFSNELRYFTKPEGKRPTLVSQLDLFVDKDGLLRCNGRLERSQLKEDTKHPILIPKDSHLSILIITAHHSRTMHGGAKLTVASIRQRFWIPQIRQCAKKCLNDCVTCRRIRGTAYTTPNHAPLPTFRSSYSFPFTVTGIDFTGSFPLRGPKEAPKADRSAYILLFTCASSRAIHLEVVEDMTTVSFLEAFRCFVSHHSRPSIILSDNAKTFEKAAKTFQKIFRDPVVLRQLSDQQIEWRFIPKRAPWYGGFWERLVGIAKEALSKVLGRVKPTLSAFRALIANAELVLNDRPLEEPSSCVEDEESLCPAHLMYGRRLNTLPYNEEAAAEILDPSYATESNELKRTVVRHQALLKQFKKRFLNSYLPALREHHQATKKDRPATIKESDVVLVHDEKPRKEWKMAVVENLIRSHDGKIRAAEIRTAKGKTNRPISKLYPLQVSEPASPVIESAPPDATIPVSPTSRPTRKCADRARAAMKNVFDQENN